MATTILIELKGRRGYNRIYYAREMMRVNDQRKVNGSSAYKTPLSNAMCKGFLHWLSKSDIYTREEPTKPRITQS